jgi:hypothetical protein
MEFSNYYNFKTIMKSFALVALLGAVVADPLIHPDTGLAITTTGYHWYGQEPLALAQTQ